MKEPAACKKPLANKKPVPHRVCIGLGSNLVSNTSSSSKSNSASNTPAQNIQQALLQLNTEPCRLIASSSLYVTPPMGPQDQADFYNAVALIETHLNPAELLTHLKKLEQEIGRVKTYHWGPRIIDCDILLFDELQIQTETLTIPHAGMSERNFVLLPLQELMQTQYVPQKEKIAQISDLIKSKS